MHGKRPRPRWTTPAGSHLFAGLWMLTQPFKKSNWRSYMTVLSYSAFYFACWSSTLTSPLKEKKGLETARRFFPHTPDRWEARQAMLSYETVGYCEGKAWLNECPAQFFRTFEESAKSRSLSWSIKIPCATIESSYYLKGSLRDSNEGFRDTVPRMHNWSNRRIDSVQFVIYRLKTTNAFKAITMGCRTTHGLDSF